LKERCASNKDGACPEATSDTLAHSQTSIRMVTSIESRLKLAARSFRTQHIAIKATRSLGTKEKWQYLFCKEFPPGIAQTEIHTKNKCFGHGETGENPHQIGLRIQPFDLVNTSD